MSNQLQITGGAKVRNLEGVLTGTSGVVSSLGINVPSGIPQLDGSGKILVSQLPNSVMEYKGTWDAATNTPTLADGTGNQGDVYLCSVAGTVNFGAGPITFAVGDQVIYSGTIWQKASGATGTVTSVAVTESGDALTITGSPITTSGTINIGFAGTGLQYIKGDGTLATFPTTIDQAKRLITEVYNSTGATLTKGTVVYINGGQGNLPTVTMAQANNDANSAQTYGVVQSDITNNNNGFVVVIGSLTDIDTSAYAIGTQLYLSGTTAGAWTSTKPSAPIHLVYVGIVVRSHPTQGVVEIRIQNGYELEELHDVAISSPVNNQGIFYNSSNSLWENKSIATALGYTPADNSLVVHLAGTETITGGKTFTGSASFNSSLGNSPIFSYGAAFVKGNSPSSTSGAWSQIYSASGDNNIVIADDLNTSKLQFQVDSSYTYTFPNLSGTLALLEGTQTFTGDKTFNGGVDFNNALNINNTFNLRNNLVGSTDYTNFSILKSGSLETLSLLFSTANSSKLVFNDAANYTYTFPTTSGTLALTSNLSSYVPYTGATAAVDLGSNALTALALYSNAGIALSLSGQFTGGGGYTGINGQALGIDIRPNSGGIFNLNFSSTTNRTFTFPDASGTLVLGIGTTNYLPKFTGTSTIGNSMLTDDGTTLQSIGATRSNLYLKAASNSYYSQLAFTNGSNGSFGGISYNNSGQYMQFETNSSEWMRLTSDGKLGIGTTSPASILHAIGAIRSSNSGNTISTRIESDGLYTAGSDMYIVNGTSNIIFYSTSERMRITSSGNVGIGTSSPVRPLDVYDASTPVIAMHNSTTTGASDRGFLMYVSGSDSYIQNKESSGILGFITGGNSERMRITSGGNVLIGRTSVGNSSYALQFDSGNPIWFNNGTSYSAQFNLDSGGFYVRTQNSNGVLLGINATSWSAYTSDVRKKKNFETTQGLAEILQIEPVKYHLLTDEDSDVKRLGFKAQNIQPLIPEMVHPNGQKDDDGSDILTITPDYILPVLVKAIQEQQEIINQLSAKVTALENK